MLHGQRLYKRNLSLYFHILYCFVKRFDLTWVKPLLPRQECVVGRSSIRIVVGVDYSVRCCAAVSNVWNVQVVTTSKRRAMVVVIIYGIGIVWVFLGQALRSIDLVCQREKKGISIVFVTCWIIWMEKKRKWNSLKVSYGWQKIFLEGESSIRSISLTGQGKSPLIGYKSTPSYQIRPQRLRLQLTHLNEPFLSQSKGMHACRKNGKTPASNPQLLLLPPICVRVCREFLASQ